MPKKHYSPGEIIAEAVGLTGRFIFNVEKPEGTPRKLSDVSSISALGWRASMALRPGIASAYRWFLNNIAGRDVNCTPAPARAFS